MEQKETMIEFYNRQANYGIRADPVECMSAMRDRGLAVSEREPNKKLVELLSPEKKEREMERMAADIQQAHAVFVMSNRSKRAHPPASGDTPGKPPKQTPRSGPKSSSSSSRKSLFQSELKPLRPSDVQWNNAEIRALIEYVALYHTPNEDRTNVWPAHKQEDFWEKCAEAVAQCSGGCRRSWNACRDKVRRFLREKFESLGDADDAYDINYFDDDVFPSQQDVISSTPQHNDPGASRQAESPMLAFSPLRNADDRTLPGSIDVVSAGFMKLTQRQQKQLIVHLFHKWLLADVHPELNSNYVPRDFLHLLTSALRVLYVNAKNNVL
ncbi:hypothetical protein OS493_001581 [Desmophyllum pertusum]|uniref:Myb-like domain-containing protein n=1 Tax=Desmophyllum pertusum TaxID=174260 RepID=A0A9W9ZHI4_9CNID|nr:hypothetical protein OS493_001581 [Desmophyllum pertusum]